MRVILNSRWSLPCVYAGSMIALIAVVLSQHQNLSKLRQDYAYVEPLAVRLTQENADLKWRADAWEKEAVRYRQQFGAEAPESP